MIAAADCHYRHGNARCAAILFRAWDVPTPDFQVSHVLGQTAPYEPGSFYKRELPCLLKILDQVRGLYHTVVIDGYVWLAPDDRPGLGAHLYRSMAGSIAVVGVAKTPFRGSTNAHKVFRGKSHRPLYITSAGMSPTEAAEHVKLMHGEHRIPTLLKLVDKICRA